MNYIIFIEFSIFKPVIIDMPYAKFNNLKSFKNLIQCNVYEDEKKYHFATFSNERTNENYNLI